MGNLVSLECSHCDFKFVGKYGIGKTDLVLDQKEFLSPEEQEVGVNFTQYIVDNPNELVEIKEIIRTKKPVILKTWEHQPYYCPKCARLYNRFTYQFIFCGGQFSPSFKCMDCETQLEKLDIKQKVSCPQCRQGGISAARIVKWD